MTDALHSRFKHRIRLIHWIKAGNSFDQTRPFNTTVCNFRHAPRPGSHSQPLPPALVGLCPPAVEIALPKDGITPEEAIKDPYRIGSIFSAMN